MNFFTITFLTVFIGLVKGVNYNTKRNNPITGESTAPKMFPSEEIWKTSQIDTEKRDYFDSLFSKAFYQRDCEHETRLKPVYYFPGEIVTIECFMCNIALVLNGSPKRWGRVRNIDDFMMKGEKFGSKDGPEVEMVENAEYLEDQTTNSTTRKLGEPYYQQSNGFLVINDANVFSQGVYFCFDEDSVASQRYFYVLIPIIPVFHISKQSSKEIKKISNGCSDSGRSFPNHFWKSTNEAESFDDQETCFARNGYDDWTCYNYRQSKRTEGCENPTSSCKLTFSPPTLPMEIPLSISLQWSPWSECIRKKQKRTGQCFISLDRELTESDALTKKWDWLWKLNRMSKNIAFREGLPLFNGLLASWLYGVELDSCLDSELSEKSVIDGYDTFYSDVFDTIFSNTTNKFETPESPFKYCLKHVKVDEKCDTLQGTYTEDERIC